MDSLFPHHFSTKKRILQSFFRKKLKKHLQSEKKYAIILNVAGNEPPETNIWRHSSVG